MKPPTPQQTTRRWRVPLSDVLIDEELLTAARDVLSSGWWSMGPRVERLEGQFAALCETDHALAVANGTAALHLALLAVGCGPGDEVVLPSLNFVAAANATHHTGATPVFCDVVGERDLNLDPVDLEAALGEQTRAVVLLHYAGFPCNVEPVVALCRARGIAIVEDAAHAIGATRDGRPCGSLGDVGCFSFFANKNVPVGEGGMIVTHDEELARRMRLLRSHGMTTLTWDRHRGHAADYDVILPGFNYRLDEHRAALASVQLGRLAERNAARAAHALRYRAALEGRRGIVVPFDHDDDASHHLFVVVLPEEVSRAEVRDHLAGEGIQTSVHYPPIHSFSAFSSLARKRPLPWTEALGRRLLTLPLYPHMTGEQVDAVARALLGTLDASSALAG